MYASQVGTRHRGVRYVAKADVSAKLLHQTQSLRLDLVPTLNGKAAEPLEVARRRGVGYNPSAMRDMELAESGVWRRFNKIAVEGGHV